MIEVCKYFMTKRDLKKQTKVLFLKNIQLIVYDFDGVLTDNKVILREDGIESVVVNRSDGLAIGIINDRGIKQIILTMETNKVVEARANKLNIPVIKGVVNKKETLVSYCNENNIQLSNVVYIGNDINDFEVMSIVGYPVCPLDAYEEIKRISKIILEVKGGEGVVRDFLNYIEPDNKEKLKCI